MKTLLIAPLFFSLSASAAVRCLGTTINFFDDGTSTSEETPLVRVSGQKNHAEYFGESAEFEFWAKQNGERIHLLITDKSGVVVVDRQNAPLARFNVSVAGYRGDTYGSLKCTPVQN